MANIITSKTINYYQRKPPLGAMLNYSHPLSQGMVGCWLMNEGGGSRIIDLANKYIGTLQSISYFKNNSLRFDYPGYVNLGTPSKLEGLQVPLTIVIRFTVDRLIGNTQSIYAAYSEFAQHNLWSMVRIENTNHLVYWTSKSTGVAQTYDPNYIPTEKTKQFLIISVSGNTSAPVINFFVNGTTFSSALSAMDATPLTTVPIYIGGDAANGTERLVGTVDFTYIYNRVLSPSEIQSLYVAPYQMIMPQRRRFIFQVGGGVAPAGRTYSTAKCMIYSY